MAHAAEHPEADARKAEEQLQAVKAEIERVTREVSAEQVERDRLTRELRTAELSVGRARDSLSDVRRERAEGAARRAALTTEKRAREAQLDQNRAALAGQLRAAYLIGRQEPLKLLLNQEDPALAGRMFVYYSYFGHARAGQIQLIADDVERLGELESELAGRGREARGAGKASSARSSTSSSRRASAAASVLANLEEQSHTRAQNLERLRSQQAGLEKLLRELRAAMERFPVEGNDAFTRLRGKLAWPVSGHLVARFGDARAGGVHWDGVLVATERGAPVKAVCRGRVIYADWLPGPRAPRHRRPRRRLPEPLRAQRAALQGRRRAGRHRRHHRRRRRQRWELAPGAVFRDPQGRQAGRPPSLVQGRRPLKTGAARGPPRAPLRGGLRPEGGCDCGQCFALCAGRGCVDSPTRARTPAPGSAMVCTGS